MKLQTGDTAPDFTTTATLKGTDVAGWTLSQRLKDGPVLLVFYPGDFTAVCTKQLCDYRDNWESLSRFGAQIVGVSTNDRASHAKFSAEKDFPFLLLDDSSKEICRKYDMLLFGGISAARGFVLVGKDGRVKYVMRELLPLFRRKASEVAEILSQHAGDTPR
jgi:peroxiredoxin Q/BCP